MLFQNLRDEETYDDSNEGMKMNAMEDPYGYPDNDDQSPSLDSPPPDYKDIANV